MSPKGAGGGQTKPEEKDMETIGVIFPHLDKPLSSPLSLTMRLSQTSDLPCSKACSSDWRGNMLGPEVLPTFFSFLENSRKDLCKIRSLHRAQWSLGINKTISIKTWWEQESAKCPTFNRDFTRDCPLTGLCSHFSQTVRGRLHLTPLLLFWEKASLSPCVYWSCFLSF